MTMAAEKQKKMAFESKIQWTEATWNPWHGCKKVSDGCKYCYMYRDKDRYGLDPKQVVRSKTKFDAPLKWQEPKLIFTCSWSDWFIEDADEWRAAAWEIIKNTPQHTYQILTKRPENIAGRLPLDWGTGYGNVWLGVSVEHEDAAERRIPLLARIPAHTRFVSFEPLLAPIDLLHAQLLGVMWVLTPDGIRVPCNEGHIHWAIIGGESGNNGGRYKYRPCKLAWVENLLLQLHERGIPTFVKQLGTDIAKQLQLQHRHGGDYNEWPGTYQVREWPLAWQKNILL
jgi:protein gp37